MTINNSIKLRTCGQFYDYLKKTNNYDDKLKNCIEETVASKFTKSFIPTSNCNSILALFTT